MNITVCPNLCCRYIIFNLEYKLVKIDHECPGCKESKFFSKEIKKKPINGN